MSDPQVQQVVSDGRLYPTADGGVVMVRSADFTLLGGSHDSTGQKVYYDEKPSNSAMRPDGPSRCSPSYIARSLVYVVCTNVIPALIIFLMLTSNGLMQRGLQKILSDVQDVAAASTVHVDWLSSVSVDVDSAVNATLYRVLEVEGCVETARRTYQHYTDVFEEYASGDKVFDSVDEQLSFMRDQRDSILQSSDFLAGSLSPPADLISAFSSSCASLPAVLRNTPFFDTPNSLCVGNGKLAETVGGFMSNVDGASSLAASTLDDALEEYDTSGTVPDPAVVFGDVVKAIDDADVFGRADKLLAGVANFSKKLGQAVRYLGVLTAGFRLNSNANNAFLNVDTFGVTSFIFTMSAILDILIILLPRPTNSKVHIGKRRLVVKIVEGAELAAKDVNGKSDPYCVITVWPPPLVFDPVTGSMIVGRDAIKRSKIIYGTLNPSFQETFVFYLNNSESEVRIEMFDRDVLTMDDYM